MRVVSAERVERAKLLRTGRTCKVIAHVQNVQSYCAHSERAYNPVASAHYLCHFVVDFRDLIKPVFFQVSVNRLRQSNGGKIWLHRRHR